MTALVLQFIWCIGSIRSYTSPFGSLVPGGTLAGTGTRGRENRHTQDTNNISITDWVLVQDLGNLGMVRLETGDDVGMHCLGLFVIG